MKKLLESFSGVISISIIILYALAYSYLKGYYNQFDIDIDFYVTVTDLLFYAIKALILGGFFYSLFIFFGKVLSNGLAVLYLRRRIKKFRQTKLLNENLVDRYIDIKIHGLDLMFTPLIYFLLSILVIYITSDFVYFIFCLIFPLISFYVSKLPEKSETESRLEVGKLRDRDYIIIFLLGFVFLLTYYQGMQNSYRITNNIHYFSKPVVCEFSDGTNDFSTDVGGEFYFLGETTDYIFIYNRCTCKTLCFNKANINNLKFIDSRNVIFKVKYDFHIVDIFDTLNKIL